MNIRTEDIVLNNIRLVAGNFYVKDESGIVYPDHNALREAINEVLQSIPGESFSCESIVFNSILSSDRETWHLRLENVKYSDILELKETLTKIPGLKIGNFKREIVMREVPDPDRSLEVTFTCPHCKEESTGPLDQLIQIFDSDGCYITCPSCEEDIDVC